MRFQKAVFIILMALWESFDGSLSCPKLQWPLSKVIRREDSEEGSGFRKHLKVLLKMEEFILQFFDGEKIKLHKMQTHVFSIMYFPFNKENQAVVSSPLEGSAAICTVYSCRLPLR